MTTTLTPREYEVLEAYARLGKMRAVGHELGISYNTANTHRQSAYSKLGSTCDTEAFAAVGWLRLPDEGDRRQSLAALTLEQATRRAEEAAAGLRAAIAAATLLRTPDSNPLDFEGPVAAVTPASSLRRVV